MIGYPDGTAAQEFQKDDAVLRQRLRWRGEFRWSRLSQRSRDAYFAALSSFMPNHHAVIWDKLASNEVQPRNISTEIDMM